MTLSKRDPFGGAHRRPVVVTVGTFDGVHRGHQALLAKARARADALGGEVWVAAFSRPPRFLFAPPPGPALITTPEEKSKWLYRFGANQVETLVFDPLMASLSAEDFFRAYFCRKWNAREIVTGYNFLFGRNRQGDVQLLKSLAKARGIKVHQVPPVIESGRVISSGRIRPLIEAGELENANLLLGHLVSITGEVQTGRGMGRKLGFPTANVVVGPDKILPRGVFAARVILPTGVERRGMLNIGNRPTFGLGGPLSVEVHILDFEGTLTGRPLTIEIFRKIRSEKRFMSDEALVNRLKIDERETRKCQKII